MKTIRTPYGTAYLHDCGTLAVHCTPRQSRAWADRPGARWPCSRLAGLTVTAEFDARGDFVDLSGPAADAEDLSSAELTAWADTVMLHAGIADHPAYRS